MEEAKLLWENLQSRLWRDPLVRQDWGTEQDRDKVTWFELFYDLIYVALCVLLGSYLKADICFERVIFTVLYFSLFWNAWFAVTSLRTRFYNDDLFTSAWNYLHSAAVLSMGAFIYKGPEKELGFAITSALSFLFLVPLYWQIRVGNTRGRFYANILIRTYLIISILLLVSGFTPKIVTGLIWALVYVVNSHGNNSTYKRDRSRLPINVEHVAERLGLFMMLILGESLISLLNAIQIDSAHAFLVLLFGFGIAHSFETLYFGAQPHDANEHALRHTKRSGRRFVHIHMLLGAALLCLGVGLKAMISHSYTTAKYSETVLLCESLAAALVLVNLLRFCHPFKSRPHGVWTTRVVVILGIAASPAIFGDSTRPAVIVCVLWVLTAVLAFLDVIAADIPKQDLRMVIKKRTDSSKDVLQDEELEEEPADVDNEDQVGVETQADGKVVSFAAEDSSQTRRCMIRPLPPFMRGPRKCHYG